jgi:hypothetical protein
MTAYLLSMYVLNGLAPAAVLALLMALIAPRWPFLRASKPWVAGWGARFFWGLAVNALVMLVGMWLGAAGKMWAYAVLVIVSALSQFVMLGLWRR